MASSISSVVISGQACHYYNIRISSSMVLLGTLKELDTTPTMVNIPMYVCTAMVDSTLLDKSRFFSF